MPSILPELSPVRLSSCSRPYGESGPHDEGRRKAGIILMGRIRYQEAIGLEVKRGRPPLGPAPSKADLVRLYVKEGQSVRDVAAAVGCSKDTIHRALRKYSIAAHPSARKSALLEYSLRELQAGIRHKGLRGFAREQGISPGTILHHIGTRKRK